MSETVQTILSTFDTSIMFLVWPSLQAYKKDKEQWERIIYRKYKDVHTITHLDKVRSVLAYAYREGTESEKDVEP